jgi:hypothetical protein
MTDPVPATPEEPLDPAVLRIQKRVTRLMLIAGLTLGIGLLTIFGAIIYRLATYGDKSPAVEVISPVPAAAPATPPATVVEATPNTPAESAPVPAAPTPAAGASAEVEKAIANTKAVLPARAWLVSASISGDRVLLAYEHANGSTIFTVDAGTLQITGRLDLKPE